MTERTLHNISMTSLALSCFTLGIQLGACSAPAKLPEPTIEQKEATAETKYTTELVACVRSYPDIPDQNRCADRVRAAWAKDGGR